MKMRVRDRKLPASGKTKKFRSLRLKNSILKLVIGALILSNCYSAHLLHPEFLKSLLF